MTPATRRDPRPALSRTDGGIHTLPGYATGAADQGIPDPYGLTMAAYRNTVRHLYEHMERVVDRLRD